jgi:hypothetical protein
VAEIRRESRQRTLDELKAFSTHQPIEAGVGVDVERAYWLVRLAMRQEWIKRAGR